MAILYSVEVKITALLEAIVAFLAPNHCILCGIEDNIVCEACHFQVFETPESACIFCESPTIEGRVCTQCYRLHPMHAIFPAATYEGHAAAVLRRFKFGRARAAAKPLAMALDRALPYLEPDTCIVPLPTASRRVRRRGYDQTLLIASQLGTIRNLPVITPLRRVTDSRQVGATRAQRFAQAAEAYELAHPAMVKDKKILLVDDICTTGASLSAAGRLMWQAGARHITATVVARKQDKKKTG